MSGFGGRATGSFVGPHRRVALAQVVEHGGRHDGHDAELRREPPAALLEPVHHAAGGSQTERAASGQHDGVNDVDRPIRLQQNRLARAWRRAQDLA